LRGGSFRRVLRTQVLRRGGCRARHPGDRPPAVPAESRCRARQHHDQAVNVAPSAPGAMKMSQPAGRNAAHCPCRPLHPQGHPKILSSCSAKTAPQKASSGPTLGARSLCRPGGPDGVGQARGQARNARGEPHSSHYPEEQQKEKHDDIERDRRVEAVAGEVEALGEEA
jgi:hypothetical protein